MAIHGHIWPCMAIYGHIWSDMAIYGPYMTIYGHIYPYMAIYGHIWSYMTIYGPYMDIYGPYIAIYGHIKRLIATASPYKKRSFSWIWVSWASSCLTTAMAMARPIFSRSFLEVTVHHLFFCSCNHGWDKLLYQNTYWMHWINRHIRRATVQARSIF